MFFWLYSQRVLKSVVILLLFNRQRLSDHGLFRMIAFNIYLFIAEGMEADSPQRHSGMEAGRGMATARSPWK